jgi:hypothetical protein
MTRAGTWLRIVAVAAFLAAVGASCTTAAAPVPALPAKTPGARGLIVIVHGVEGRAKWWPLRLESAFRRLDVDQDLWDIYRPDWHEMSLDRLAAPRLGYALGRELGTGLVGRADTYDVIHLIGHSAGAHVIQGIADAVGDLSGATVVYSTFLDPFVVRSVVRLFWGVRRLGASSDFAECYVTRDDPLPFTNSFLKHANNVDLTPILPRVPDAANNYAHLWPIDYYISTATSTDVSGVRHSPLFRLGSNVTAQRAASLAAELRTELPPGHVTVPE